ncbi:hypothetical protein Pfo_002091 [Paulownia fortunei]|nr:hypothetical protein Pfo_002091 [Paulownia fortunei]
MCASPNSSTSNTSKTNLPIFNPSSSINLTKLTRFNYPTYVDSTLRQPAKTITASDGSTTLNPSYDVWETQNNLILCCINFSFSGTGPSRLFNTCSLSTLNSQLFWKGNQSATNYFMTIKHSLISMVSHRDNSFTLEEFYSILLRFPRGMGCNQLIGNCGGGRINNTVCCQLCDKPARMAFRCWKHFDLNFQTPPSRPNPQANLASSQSQKQTKQEWHPDTGATHYLTNNMSNLNIRSNNFFGNDQIQIDNGTNWHCCLGYAFYITVRHMLGKNN